MVNAFGVRVLCLAAFCFGCSPLFAQEFSADMVRSNTETNESTTSSKIYVSKDKLRIEPQEHGGMGGGSGIVLLDLSTQTSHILIPQRHMYMENMQGHGPQRAFSFFRPTDLEDACSDWLKLARKPGGSCHKVGHEMVNGRDTVKYEGTSADGDIGDVWLDAKLKFVVKWQGKSSSGELRNIQEAAQPASLFEIPSDYQKMEMGGMRMAHPTPQQ